MAVINPAYPNAKPTQPPKTTPPDYQKDYWAQDRPQVLAANGLTDTSGKTWNGTEWATGGVAPTAPSAGPTYGSYTNQAGWDNTKLQNPDKHDPKYDWLRSVQSVGGNTDLQKAVDYYNTNFGQYNPKASVVGGSNDQVNFGGNYGNVDVLFDQEGARKDLWAPQAAPGAGGPQGIANSGISGFGSFGGASGTGSGLGGDYLRQLLGGSGQSSGISATLSGMGGLPSGAPGNLYSQLQGRANQGLAVNSRDPIIANQVDSYRAEQDRGARNYIDQQAEARGPYSNLNSERRLANEHAAQATGSLQASVMQNELTAGRGEIQNALSQMGSMLSDQQKIALQQQLGYIDAALQQQRITNQNNQFLDQYGLDYWDKSNFWDKANSGY